jgi:hypothetical protein
MFVYWSAIDSYEETGGSPIISYGLEWDNGTNELEWIQLQGYMSNSLITAFTEQSVTKGVIYNFRL